MEKRNIRITPRHCTQCSRCRLRCSFVYSKIFDPSQARIVAEAGNIHFTDDCIANCHLGTDSCVYGALVKMDPAPQAPS